MTIAQPPLLLAQPQRNQHLFTDYYLNTLLPRREDWQALVEPARPVMQRVAAIIAAYRPSPNEAQLERELVRPVLEALGHTFEVQAALRTPDGAKRPDYVFYRDQAALDANKGETLTDALLQAGGLAVGDAKAWDRPLDIAQRGSADPFSNKNPSYQIGFYIQHSGVEWGILTNGRLWRLYHRDTAHKQDRFYEVDLPALIDAGSLEAFLYFYAFFHRSAFEPQPLGVRALLDASGDYARGVCARRQQQPQGTGVRRAAPHRPGLPRLRAQRPPARPAGAQGDLRQLADSALPAAVHLLRRGARPAAAARQHALP
jgi:hypothetical protein